VHYSRTALTSTLSDIQESVGSWRGYGRRVDNITLGSDAKKKGCVKEKTTIGLALKKRYCRRVETPAMEKPMVIILTGDMFSDADFKSILEDAIGDYLG
jgi:hypothetical protein